MHLQRKVLILPFAYNFFSFIFSAFFVYLCISGPSLASSRHCANQSSKPTRDWQSLPGLGRSRTRTRDSASYFGALLLSPSLCFFLISKGILLCTLLYYSTFHFFVFYIIITFSSFKFHVFMLLSDSLSFFTEPFSLFFHSSYFISYYSSGNYFNFRTYIKIHAAIV